MLTRAQVAKRLGKSIATVRRLEGVALHPVLDVHGAHRFDPMEVERIAKGSRGQTASRRTGGHAGARSDWFASEHERRDAGSDNDRDERDDEEEALAHREAEIAGLAEEISRREHELHAREYSLQEREARLARARDEAAEEASHADRAFGLALRVQAGELLDKLDKLSPRAAAKILSEDDMLFLAAVVRADFE